VKNSNKTIIAIVLIAAVIMTQKAQATTSTAPAQNQPRGIRNNNPLNIRYSAANDWQGQTGTDGEYAIFESAQYGIRAAAKLLNNYVTKYGLRSVSGIINRWAPTIENNTSAYIQAVANKLNVQADDVLLWPTQLKPLLEAMIHHENGVQPYSQATIINGIKMAGLYE